MRHDLHGQPGTVGGEATRGEMIEAHAVLEVADGVLDLGVAAMVGFGMSGVPTSVGDEADIFGDRAPCVTNSHSWQVKTSSKMKTSPTNGSAGRSRLRGDRFYLGRAFDRPAHISAAAGAIERSYTTPEKTVCSRRRSPDKIRAARVSRGARGSQSTRTNQQPLTRERLVDATMNHTQGLAYSKAENNVAVLRALRDGDMYAGMLPLRTGLCDISNLDV